MDELIEEIRQQYHIPPFVESSAISVLIGDGEHRLSRLNPGRDYDTDRMYRSLIKSYVYYAYHGKIDAWRDNYAADILEWQMTSEVDT